MILIYIFNKDKCSLYSVVRSVFVCLFDSLCPINNLSVRWGRGVVWNSKSLTYKIVKLDF